MADICGDNRFKIIESAKQRLIDATNIESRPEEMAVLDSILFRMWQMHWLPGCERAESEQDEFNQKRLAQIGEAVSKKEPIYFLSGEKYVPERTCKVEWKHIGDDVAAGYCECGIELDRCHDYEPAHLPTFCPACGVKVVGD